MGMYKAAVDAAERAEEQLTTFKRMIAKKEAQLAAEKRPPSPQRAKLRVKPKEQV